MTTLAGSKIRKHRYAQRPRMTRAQFGARYGRPRPVAATTVQGWEEENKRPTSHETVNAIAIDGIAAHQDWYVPATCPRCELAADAQEVPACQARDCPLALRGAA